MNIFEKYNSIGEIKELDLDQHNINESNQKESLTKEEFSLFLKPFFIFKFLIIGLLIFRLLNLQIIHGSQNLYAAQGNFIRKRTIPAPRGIIMDINHKPLVENIASYNLEIFPGELPKDKGERLEIYQKLIDDLGINREILIKLEESQLMNLDPVIIKENLTHEESISIEIALINLPGVEVVKRPTRNYLAGNYLSHILGYIGKISEEELKQSPQYRQDAYIGKIGIEYQYEKNLKGEDGYAIVEVDSKGRVQQVKPGKEAVIGQNIQLTINLDIQKEIEKIVQEYSDSTQYKKISVILMKPQNGEIVAMVSSPGYDANQFIKGMDANTYNQLLKEPNLPFLNRPIAGQYPSGSAIKPVYAVAGLNEKIITPNTSIATPPAISIGQWVFPDWKPHGSADVRKAIAESNNIFFYALGGGYDKIKGLGVNRMTDYLNRFGFGQKTGIDIPGEKNGKVPTPEEKKSRTGESWYIGDTYHLAIGQGDFLVTPLQIARATASFANNGNLVTPHLIGFIDEDTKNLPQFIIKPVNVASENIQVVREGMRQTVTAGSAGSLNNLPVKVAGKTGTAQFGVENKTHSWFTSFAPYDNPEYTLTVLVEGVEGNSHAVPMAKQIYQYLYPN